MIQQTYKDNIGNIIKAVRLFLGENQIKFAKTLGTSQASLSKFEAGILEPNLEIWFNLVNVAKIRDPESFRTGFVELDLPKLNGFKGHNTNGFKLPRRYDYLKNISVKKVLPLIAKFEKEFGAESFNNFLKDRRIKPEFFCILNNQINSNFIIDLLEQLNLTGKSPAEFYSQLEEVTQKEFHGDLFTRFDKSTKREQILKAFITKQANYGIDVNYTVSEDNPFVIEMKNDINLTSFDFKSDDIKMAYNMYNICFPYNLQKIKFTDVKAPEIDFKDPETIVLSMA